MGHDELQAAITEMRAVIARQDEELRVIRSRLKALDADGSEAADEPVDAPTSRRRLFALAGGAAAAAVGAVAATARPVAATNGNPIGIATTTAASAGAVTRTLVDYSLTAGAGDYFVVTDVASASTPSLGAMLGAFNSAGPNNIAIQGSTTRAGGVGVQGDGGTSGYALFAAGTGRVGSAATSPSGPPAGTFALRDIVGDTAGNLYANIAAGTPGVFRKLSGPATAGQLHIISPVRVYDSRVPLPAPGPLVAGTNRTISVANSRDLATGAVVTANVVPPGATAVACNMVVVNTQAPAGFLAVNPGGNPTVAASSINWSAAGQILANGIIAALGGDRQLTIIAGASAGTDFALDITGYYL